MLPIYWCIKCSNNWPPILDMMINCIKFWGILFSDKAKFTETSLFKTKIGGFLFFVPQIFPQTILGQSQVERYLSLVISQNHRTDFFFRKSSDPIFKARLMSMLKCNNFRGGTPSVYIRPIMIAQYMLVHPMPTFVGTSIDLQFNLIHIQAWKSQMLTD